MLEQYLLQPISKWLATATQSPAQESKDTEFMAKKTHTILVDDLDGSNADETVTFGIDGATYEIDLTSANAAALREALAPFVAAGQRVTPARRSRSTRSTGTSANSAAGSRSSDIRAWALAEGLTVNTRGRLPASVVAAYDAAHA